MKKFVVPVVFVLFFISVSLARATDVNCPDGGEMDLDEIINEMMEENVVQDCNDLANYEIECTEIGWWREWDGYLSVSATFAGNTQDLYWMTDPANEQWILHADADGVIDHGTNLWITTGPNSPLFYFKDVTSGETWYSRDGLNDDSSHPRHMVVYRLGNDTFICGFEDLAGGGDEDYQDLVFKISHAAPSCIPVINNIPDQAVTARGTFATIDLDDYLVHGDYTEAEVTWEASAGTDVFVSIDPGTRVATVTYNYDWTGGEYITFTATGPEPERHSFDSEPVHFQVMEPDAPVVHDIPDQRTKIGRSFQEIHLDDYVDPPPNYENSDVQWTWNNLGGGNISVTIENRIATITYPSYWTGSERIRFIGTVNPSGSSTSTFTVVSYLSGLGVGGVAHTADRFDIAAPWIVAVIFLAAAGLSAIIWRKRRFSKERGLSK